MISRTTRSFWSFYDALPREVQRQAVRSYVLWRANTRYPSLQFKCIHEAQAAYSVRVGIHWRAIGFLENGVVTWFWIGSHADYDRLIASL